MDAPPSAAPARDRPTGGCNRGRLLRPESRHLAGSRNSGQVLTQRVLVALLDGLIFTWDSSEPGWAVNNGQVLWLETRTARGPHPLINLVSPDLGAALERDEAYNQQVAATAKTPSTELNRQLAEAWSGSDMDYIRLLMDALHLQFWRDGQTTRALIEARASQLIDNHDGDRGGVQTAWEQARHDDRDYDEEVARTALKIMDSRARLSMAPGA